MAIGSDVRSKLLGMVMEDSFVAQRVLDLITARLEATQADVLSETAYSFTPEGVARLCAMLDAPHSLAVRSSAQEQEQAYARYLAAKPVIRAWVDSAAVYSAVVNQNRAQYETLAMQLIHEADADPDFEDCESAFGYWRQRWAILRNESPPRGALVFGAMALLTIPCGEACAERLFSTFEWLFDARRRRATCGTLQDELVVFMWQVYTGKMVGLPYNGTAVTGLE